MAVLPAAAWWAAGPAIGLCATIPWFVDQSDLDARWVNAIPALGVAIALVLTVAAARAAGASLAPRRPWDRWRIVVAVVVVLVSLPWITAELGFHFPGDLFMGEELGREKDGTTIAAVHLGHHHGTDGAVLFLTALLLSRVAVQRGALRIVVFAYLGTMLAYGGVNFVQDAWNEQIVKRGWTDASIPSALLPGAKPIWVVVSRARSRGHFRAAPGGEAHVILRVMTQRMVFLGFGKYARADKIYALEPITGDDRGGGRRTRVWVEGVGEPLVASRTERTILHDMGHEAGDSVLLDGALDLAERLAAAAEEGRVDLGDLGRRARKLLAATARPAESEPLF